MPRGHLSRERETTKLNTLFITNKFGLNLFRKSFKNHLVPVVSAPVHRCRIGGLGVRGVYLNKITFANAETRLY